MPSTERQRRAAFAELGNRKKGAKKQSKKAKRKRAFGAATRKTLMDFAHSPLKK